MAISRPKILAAAALALAFGSIGRPASGEPRGRGGAQEPARSLPDHGTGRATPARSGDETARSIARLADALKRHPARRVPMVGDRHRLYMMDLVESRTTLIADETEPGFNWCNEPKWSQDGTRIIFATWPLPGFERCRIKLILSRDGLPRCVDLGPGHSPTFSPDDRRIAFTLEPGSEEGEPGVWVMQADGSGRRRVSEAYGTSFWSPDGREFLLCGYAQEHTIINLEMKEAGILEVPGRKISSWPSWAGPGTLISALGPGEEGDSIALLDVRQPAEAKVIEVLWKRSDGPDVNPRWPVYREDTRVCIFVGEEPTQRLLLSVKRGVPGRVKRLEPRGYNDKLGGLAFSPDGRYLLFCGNRPAP